MKKILFVLLAACLLGCTSGNKTESANNDNLESKATVEAPLVSIEERNGLLAENIEIVGKWIDQRPAAGTIITLIKDVSKNEFYLKFHFTDGSESLDKVRMSKKSGLDKVYVIGEQHGEYYIIEKNNSLGMYGQNGKFNECITY